MASWYAGAGTVDWVNAASVMLTMTEHDIATMIKSFQTRPNIDFSCGGLPPARFSFGLPSMIEEMANQP